MGKNPPAPIGCDDCDDCFFLIDSNNPFILIIFDCNSLVIKSISLLVLIFPKLFVFIIKSGGKSIFPLSKVSFNCVYSSFRRSKLSIFDLSILITFLRRFGFLDLSPVFTITLTFVIC